MAHTETFTQTDTAPTCGNGGVAAWCSGRSASAGATDSMSAEIGGVAGSTPISCTINASQSNVVFLGIDLGALPSDYGAVKAGTYAFKVNLTSGGSSAGVGTITEAHLCRVSSACASLESIGSVTGLSIAINTGDEGVKTLNVVVATSKALQPTDRLVLAVVGTNTSSMTAQTYQFTPDQTVDIDLLKVTPYRAMAVCANVAGAGNDWTDLDASALEGGELSADDGDMAAVLEASGATSDVLSGTNGGFSGDVPANSTMFGAQVGMIRKDDAVDTASREVASQLTKLIQEGSIVGSDFGETGVNWTATETEFFFGGAVELGGVTWTRDQAVAATTGVAVQLTWDAGLTTATNPTHAFERVRMRWFYEEPTDPVYDQDTFRGRNDDGSETTATWKATAGTDFSVRADEVFRLRFLVQATINGEAGFKPTVYYRVDHAGAGYGAWAEVAASAIPFPLKATEVARVESANLTHGADTTQQIGAGSFTSNNNGVIEDGALATLTTVTDEEWEVEVALMLGRFVNNPGDTFQFKVTNDGTDLDTYTDTPTVTVLATPPPFSDQPSGVNASKRLLLHVGG